MTCIDVGSRFAARDNTVYLAKKGKNMDWHSDRDLSHWQASKLTELQELRTDRPIVWALVNGVRTSESIAARINWPHDWVMIHLRELKKETVVYDTEGKASVEWHLMPDEEALIELQIWVNAQRQPGGIFKRNDRNDE